MQDSQDDELLTEQEAADFLKVKRNTLTIWRADGRTDPPYLRVGRLIRYYRRDLRLWLDKNSVGGSTVNRAA